MPPAYMVAIYRQIDASSLNSDGSKTAFYCVWELPIFLIVLLLLTLHLPRMFLLGEVGEQRRGEQEGAKDRWTELEGGASPSTTRGSEARV